MLGALAAAFAAPAVAPSELSIALGTPPVDITDLYPFLVEASVETARGKAAVGTLRLDSRREPDGHWTVQDRPGLQEGARIVVTAWFGPRSEEVLRGYIASVQASYPSDPGLAQVTVTIQDDSFVLDREHRRDVWGRDAPMSDGAIVAAVLARHPPLAGDIRGQGAAAVTLNQDATDAAFLRARAEANGYDLIYDQGTVYFGPPRLSDPPQPTILVYAGTATNCLSFDIEVDGQAADTVVTEFAPEGGGDPRRQSYVADNTLLGAERATATALGLAPREEKMSGDGGSNEADLAVRAQARVNALSFRIKGTGELDGDLYGHVLKPGLPVIVDGVGERFSGAWMVEDVRHHFAPQGYKQSVTLLRNGVGAGPGDFAAGQGALPGVF